MVGIQDSGCRIHQVACEILENDRTIAVIRRLEEGHREEERREGEGKAKGLVVCTLYPGLDPPRQRGGRRAAGAPEFDGGKFLAQIRNNFLGKKANTKLDDEDMQRLRSLPWFRKLQRKWKLNAVSRPTFVGGHKQETPTCVACISPDCHREVSNNEMCGRMGRRANNVLLTPLTC